MARASNCADISRSACGLFLRVWELDYTGGKAKEKTPLKKTAKYARNGAEKRQNKTANSFRGLRVLTGIP